jgi:uncharacterized membrane protein
MRWLIRLYPAGWRERYGDELEQLLCDLRPSASKAAVATDLVRGALDARLQRGIDMQKSDRTAIGRGVLIGAIIWLGLSVEVLLSNVVFPSKTDDDAVPVLVSYLCIFAALFLTGMVAARGGAGRKGQIIAGLVAGAMIGALTVATFAIVDNVWLDIVARQQTKIDGFAHSGAASMREYINDGLIGAAVFLTIALGVLGAALSLLGGFVGREPLTQFVKRTKV